MEDRIRLTESIPPRRPHRPIDIDLRRVDFVERVITALSKNDGRAAEFSEELARFARSVVGGEFQQRRAMRAGLHVVETADDRLVAVKVVSDGRFGLLAVTGPAFARLEGRWCRIAP